MLFDLVIRFVLGGVIVSVFAIIGEIFTPKTFSGLFGAAPSVALASMALAFSQHGGAYVGLEARSMLLGAVAFFCYAALCVRVARSSFSVWSGAASAWLAWLAVAASLWLLVLGDKA